MQCVLQDAILGVLIHYHIEFKSCGVVWCKASNTASNANIMIKVVVARLSKQRGAGLSLSTN